MASTMSSVCTLQAGSLVKNVNVSPLVGTTNSLRVGGHFGAYTRFQSSHWLAARCQATRPGTTETSTSGKEDNGSAATPSEGLNLNFIPPPDAPAGTFEEVMAFTGPAPEVINGRLAMWGFLFTAIGELTAGQTIGQQFSASTFSVLSTTFFVTVASFIPALLADVPFGELLETASAEGMPPQLKIFNYSVEKWTGRVAMLAFVIFLIIEGFSGQATLSLLTGRA